MGHSLQQGLHGEGKAGRASSLGLANVSNSGYRDGPWLLGPWDEAEE